MDDLLTTPLGDALAKLDKLCPLEPSKPDCAGPQQVQVHGKSERPIV